MGDGRALLAGRSTWNEDKGGNQRTQSVQVLNSSRNEESRWSAATVRRCELRELQSARGGCRMVAYPHVGSCDVMVIGGRSKRNERRSLCETTAIAQDSSIRGVANGASAGDEQKLRSAEMYYPPACQGVVRRPMKVRLRPPLRPVRRRVRHRSATFLRL